MGQAALVGDRRLANSPWAHTFQDASSDVDRGALYLNIEGVDEETAHAVTQEIARVYFESVSVSTETALLRSVKHAYRHLYEAGVDIPLAEVGLTAVLMLDDRASIAQALPTQFYLIQDEQITALPDTQERLSGPGSASQPPPPDSRYPQWEPPVEMFRATPDAQDVAALCTDNIGAALSDGEVRDIVGRGGIQSAAENLVDTARQRGEQFASVLLLRFVAVEEKTEPAAEAPAEQTPDRAGPQKSGNPVVTVLGLLLALVMLAWSVVASPFRPRSRAAASSGRTSTVATESTIAGRAPSGRARGQRFSRLAAGAIVILLLIALVIAANALFGDRDTSSSASEVAATTPLPQVTASPAQPTAVASPAPAEPTPAATPAPPATPEPGSVLLTASQDLVRFEPDVQQPGEIYGLANTVYVLDRASGAVYRIGSDGSNDFAYQPTGDAGSAARHITGRDDVIQILDSANRLFHVTNEEESPQPVQLPTDSVGQTQSTATYDENFYVLDTVGNDVLRFRPVGSGVYAEPEGYFGVNSGVDLAQATDLAIDGSVFILFSDGAVNRYVSGARSEFSLASLPSPLGTPGAIFISQGMGSLYILDGDNDRILQVTTEGVFQRQFLAPNRIIANAVDLYVNAEETSLWLVSPTGVTRFPLPSLPEDAPRSSA